MNKEELEKQLEEDAQKYINETYISCAFKSELIRECINFAKSESAKQYHTQNMVSEEDIEKFDSWLDDNVYLDDDVGIVLQSTGEVKTLKELFNQFKT